MEEEGGQVKKANTKLIELRSGICSSSSFTLSSLFQVPCSIPFELLSFLCKVSGFIMDTYLVLVHCHVISTCIV
jgi:hypothetical protein